MKIIEKFVVNNPCYTNGRKIKPMGIMIHSVGVSQPNPLVFVNKFNDKNASVCVHGFIGNEEVYKILPWDRRAWHCGGNGNNTHIGIEMTEPSTIKYTGGSTFIDNDVEKTKKFVLENYLNAVDLFADICLEHGFDPLKDGVIVSHSEGYKRKIASNHADCEHIWDKFGLSMNEFRKDIKENKGNKLYK